MTKQKMVHRYGKQTSGYQWGEIRGAARQGYENKRYNYYV